MYKSQMGTRVVVGLKSSINIEIMREIQCLFLDRCALMLLSCVMLVCTKRGLDSRSLPN